MIIKIQKGASFKGPVYYNEKKVTDGVAQLIDKNVLSANKHQYVQEFNQVSSLNAKLNQNKAVHFAISLSPEDKLSNEGFRSLAEDILQEMGYQNSPFLVYRHHDAVHQHIHIVTSRVDFDGKTVSDSNDVYRAIDLERKLENKYGLQEVIPMEGARQKDLKEINSEKYSFYNAYQKAQQQGLETGIVLEAKKAIPNQKIIETIGIDKYAELYENFLTQNLIYSSKKAAFINTLQQARTQSNNYEQFNAVLRSQGIEPREIIRKNNRVITFKGPSGLYIEEAKLPPELHLAALRDLSSAQAKKYDPSADLPEVKAMLTKIIQRTSSKATSLEEFRALCKVNNIEVKTFENSAGIYGISFINRGTEYKASTLHRDLSWNHLQESFRANSLESKTIRDKQSKTKDTKPSNSNQSQSSKPNLGKMLSSDSEEKEQERLRKKYNSDSSKDDEMTV